MCVLDELYKIQMTMSKKTKTNQAFKWPVSCFITLPPFSRCMPLYDDIYQTRRPSTPLDPTC